MVRLCSSIDSTVERSPGLSGHHCAMAIVMKSQMFSHRNACIVVCIKLSSHLSNLYNSQQRIRLWIIRYTTLIVVAACYGCCLVWSVVACWANCLVLRHYFTSLICMLSILILLIKTFIMFPAIQWILYQASHLITTTNIHTNYLALSVLSTNN